jgi:hypothetical protein
MEEVTQAADASVQGISPAIIEIYQHGMPEIEKGVAIYAE